MSGSWISDIFSCGALCSGRRHVPKIGKWGDYPIEPCVNSDSDESVEYKAGYDSRTSNLRVHTEGGSLPNLPAAETCTNYTTRGSHQDLDRTELYKTHSTGRNHENLAKTEQYRNCTATAGSLQQLPGVYKSHTEEGRQPSQCLLTAGISGSYVGQTMGVPQGSLPQISSPYKSPHGHTSEISTGWSMMEKDGHGWKTNWSDDVAWNTMKDRCPSSKQLRCRSLTLQELLYQLQIEPQSYQINGRNRTPESNQNLNPLTFIDDVPAPDRCCLKAGNLPDTRTVHNSGTGHNSGTIHAAGTVHNSGTIHTARTVHNFGGTVHDAGTVHNSGIVHDAGTVHNSGIVHDAGTVHNSVIVHDAGIVHNSGTVHDAGIVHNTRIVSNVGIVHNGGIVHHAAGNVTGYPYEASAGNVNINGEIRPWDLQWDFSWNMTSRLKDQTASDGSTNSKNNEKVDIPKRYFEELLGEQVCFI